MQTISNQMIAEFWEFYCEYGSEMHVDDWTFLTQFFNRVQNQGTEYLTEDQIINFVQLFKKYANEESLDSGVGGLS